MSEFLQDLKFGCRTLLKSRGFTAIALATLAIGIGGNAAIFSFVNGVLLKPLPYDHPERIVRVLEKPPGGGTNGISTLNYLDWVKENTVFDAMAAQTPAQLQDYARRFIIGKPRITGVMLPTGARARLKLTEQELAGFGVTP